MKRAEFFSNNLSVTGIDQSLLTLPHRKLKLCRSILPSHKLSHLGRAFPVELNSGWLVVC